VKHVTSLFVALLKLKFGTMRYTQGSFAM